MLARIDDLTLVRLILSIRSKWDFAFVVVAWNGLLRRSPAAPWRWFLASFSFVRLLVPFLASEKLKVLSDKLQLLSLLPRFTILPRIQFQSCLDVNRITLPAVL